MFGKGKVEENEEERVEEKPGNGLLKPFVGSVSPGGYSDLCQKSMGHRFLEEVRSD
jgi:hypothetical protein